MGLGVALLGEDARFVPHRGGGTCCPPNLALVRRRVGILLLVRRLGNRRSFGGKDTAAPVRRQGYRRSKDTAAPVRRQGYCRSSSAVRKPPLLERLVDGAEDRDGQEYDQRPDHPHQHDTQVVDSRPV